MVDKFEKNLIAVLAILSSLIMIYLFIEGPVFLNHIHYKTSSSGIYQLEGQDVANIVFLVPLYLIAGVAMFFDKKWFRYLLILPPLSVIYYGISVIIGMEWSMNQYTGNSEDYFYFFLFLIISSLIIMLYALPQFKNNKSIKFGNRTLIIYSIVFVLFLLMFVKMWTDGINQVIHTGSTDGYEENPTVFWVVRTFDLSLVIPLGFISLYLLWTRPNKTAAILFLFYGFFITMGFAVNAMGISMMIQNDPTIRFSQLLVFMCLLGLSLIGFYVTFKKYREA